MVQRRLAPGVGPRLLVGHVGDVLQAVLLRRLGEEHGGLDQAVREGVDEVGAGDALRRRPQVVQLEQVAVDDLRAQLLEPLGTLVLLAGHRPDAVPLLEEQLDRRSAGVARGPRVDRGITGCPFLEAFQGADCRFHARLPSVAVVDPITVERTFGLATAERPRGGLFHQHAERQQRADRHQVEGQQVGLAERQGLEEPVRLVDRSTFIRKMTPASLSLSQNCSILPSR